LPSWVAIGLERLHGKRIPNDPARGGEVAEITHGYSLDKCVPDCGSFDWTGYDESTSCIGSELIQDGVAATAANDVQGAN
jgi:hypothetical protein